MDDADDALAAVVAAEADFETAIDVAKETLVDAYKQEMVKQTESAKLENVTRLVLQDQQRTIQAFCGLF